MIKQSSLLRWTQNNRNASKVSRNWIHPAEALQRGHVAYLVKFLGNTEVEHAKGIDVVKEGIRKLKFTQQLKRSEGTKTPKVELTISVDGVAVQDPKIKKIFHQYPLHRISYCADDKSDKKFFSFIAKEADSDKHSCFVFVSDKLAEEITLTIGQAFDLAYRRFLETSGRDLEMRKQFMILQKEVHDLEKENKELRQRIEELQHLKDRTDLENYKQQNNISDLTIVNGTSTHSDHSKTTSTTVVTIQPPPPVPPRNFERHTPNSGPSSPSQDLLSGLVMPEPLPGRHLQNLDLDDLDDFNPRAEPMALNGNGHATNHERDLFGAEPFNPAQKTFGHDPFGMGNFGPSNLGAQDLENAIGAIDKRLSEMRDGFKRGLSFGNDDFSLESLDPLSNKTS